MTPRATNWSSDNPDAKVPDTVKARIVLRQNGKCALTGVRLRPGHIDFDHGIPLSMGGTHDEQNLRAVDRQAHREKTAAEAAPRAKADRVRIKHLGLKAKSKGFSGWRKFNGDIVKREKL